MQKIERNLKKEILLELQYLPNLQFVSKLLQHPKVWMEQHENYSKGSYRNRCHLATAQGLLRLSIPLMGGKHQQQPIREVRISNEGNWQTQHWTAIKSAYGKSPFFEYYSDGFRPFFQKNYEFLWDWNWDLLQQVLEFIPFEKNINLTSSFEKNPNLEIIDFRNSISPKKKNHKVDEHFFPTKYAQVFEERNGFLPNLSILDLLFCTGPEAIIYLEKSIKSNTI